MTCAWCNELIGTYCRCSKTYLRYERNMNWRAWKLLGERAAFERCQDAWRALTQHRAVWRGTV